MYGGLILELIGNTLMELLYASQKKKSLPPSTPPLNDLEPDKEKAPHRTFRLNVTGSWDRASSYALWTGVSSGTGLIRDMVVASTVSVCVFRTRVSDLCFINIF